MRLRVEKSYPYVGGVIAGAMWWYYGVTLPQNPDALLSSALTLGAILTGFLATSKTILIGLRGSDIMDKLRKSEYMKELVNYLAAAIWLSFGFSILTLLGFFVKLGWRSYYETAWIAIGTMAAAAFVRVTIIILKIIRHESADN